MDILDTVGMVIWYTAMAWDFLLGLFADMSTGCLRELGLFLVDSIESAGKDSVLLRLCFG